MIPQGDIWSNLLTSGLLAIPSDAYSYTGTWNLESWRSSGEGRVVSASRTQIDIETSPFSFAGALLGDAQHYLDHAAEQRAFVSKLVASSDECSPSWVLVGVYYWGLFAALALSRVLGLPVLNMDKVQLKTLLSALAAGTVGPGSGSFVLRVGPVSATSTRTLSLEKLGDLRFHEAVWLYVSKDLKSRVDAIQATRKDLSISGAQYAELAMFNSLIATGYQPGEQWPSRLRNRVNYQAGFSYRSVLHSNVLDLYSFIRRAKYTGIDDVVTELATYQSSVPPYVTPDSAPKKSTKALFLRSLLLNLLGEALLREVVERNDLDRTWQQKRRRFLRRELPGNNGDWPIAAGT